MPSKYGFRNRDDEDAERRLRELNRLRAERQGEQQYAEWVQRYQPQHDESIRLAQEIDSLVCDVLEDWYTSLGFSRDDYTIEAHLSPSPDPLDYPAWVLYATTEDEPDEKIVEVRLDTGGALRVEHSHEHISRQIAIALKNATGQPAMIQAFYKHGVSRMGGFDGVMGHRWEYV